MKYLFAFFLSGIVYISRAQDTTLTPASMRLIYPVLWQQTAADYRALCYQAYNTATWRIQTLPRKLRRKKNLAIVTDIDETVLDNSYFEAQLIKNNSPYSDSLWNIWAAKGAATTVPGALDFLQFAKKKGIHIFYISNRYTVSIPATLANLRQYNFPDADSSHLLFKTTVSSKETRRQEVMKNYNVILLMGDNLPDFSTDFETKTIDSRFAAADKNREEWGKKFIVLPNPMYDDWEDAFYNNQHGLGEQEKMKVLLKLLKGFMP